MYNGCVPACKIIVAKKMSKQFLFSFWSFNLVFLKYHSTQTALIAADDDMCSVLILLDLSAAFDTIVRETEAAGRDISYNFTMVSILPVK